MTQALLLSDKYDPGLASLIRSEENKSDLTFIWLFSHFFLIRLKHYHDLEHAILRQQQETNNIRLFYPQTEHIIADIGTKLLSLAVFNKLYQYLRGCMLLDESKCFNCCEWSFIQCTFTALYYITHHKKIIWYIEARSKCHVHTYTIHNTRFNSYD